MVRLPGVGERRPSAALRRPAPARRARTRDRQPAARAAARRAARRARPQAARGDAGRAQADPARGRDHVRLRDARPGRGAVDERPDRRLEQGQDRAGRHARRGLQRPATEFVAGFVGVSNMLERDGRRFTIRPEKIRILGAGEAADGITSSRAPSRGRLRRPGTRYRDRARPGAASDRPPRHATSRHQDDEARDLRGLSPCRDGARTTDLRARTRPAHPGEEAHEETIRATPILAIACLRRSRVRRRSSNGGSSSSGEFQVPDTGRRTLDRRRRGQARTSSTGPGYAEDGSTDKNFDWVTPFEKETGCTGEREGREHLRRDGDG